MLDWSAYDTAGRADPAARAPAHARARSASRWARRWSPAAGPPRPSRPRSPTPATARGGSATCRRTRPTPARSPSATGCARSAGAQDAAAGAGFGDFQPRTSSSSRSPGAPRTDLLAGFNQLWRRNIRKADKAGVVVAPGRRRRPAGVPPALRGDRRSATASPRGRWRYFQRMFRAMTRGGPRPAPAVPGPPRGRAAGRDDLGPRRRARLVLLRRLAAPTGASSAAATPCSGG